MESLGTLKMSGVVWEQIGYKYHDRGSMTNMSDGLWQRKLFMPEGSERSDSLGRLTWYVYKHPNRTGYMAEADLDMADGPMGIRRMMWNPTELTVKVVGMVEREYATMAGCLELYQTGNNE